MVSQQLKGLASRNELADSPLGNQIEYYTNNKEKDMVKLEVFDPCGVVVGTACHAHRLSELSGKTLCEISNGEWETDRTFPLIRELLQKQFPTAKIIPYTEFPVGLDQIDIDEIGKIVKDKGCQAAIVGNAG